MTSDDAVLGEPPPSVRAGVIGDPIAHSRSPVIHEAAYRALGLDWGYRAFVVREADTARAIERAEALSFRGLSVTTPLKVAATLSCTERSAAVVRIGAANTVVFSKGRRRAENTDGEGLLNDLAASWGFDPDGKVCGVIGAGATARAVIAALAARGASEVVVVNRTREKADDAASLAGDRGRAVEVDELGSVALVVQAAALPFDDDDLPARLAHSIGAGQRVVDVVYAPPMSAFLEQAKEKGAEVRNGLGMLIHQAALQVTLFTGDDAPIEAMWAAVRRS